MLSEHFVDDLPRPAAKRRRIAVLGKDDQRLPQRPAATALPCPRVQRQRCAERFAAFPVEKCPGDGEVASRITDAGRAEIDDDGKLSVLDEKIAGRDIANPTALLLSAVLMLQHVHEDSKAAAIVEALRKVLASGHVTPDLGGSATTTSFADAICGELH